MRQFLQVARFYMPRLKKQIIFYPVIAIVLYLLIFFTARSMSFVLVVAMSGFISNMLLYFGPVILASRGGLEIETSLPVKGSIKAAFILSYTLSLFPF